MFVSFTDESGNDDQSQVFSMATIILCQFASYYFANDWQATLESFGLQSFHASAFAGGSDKRKRFEDVAIQLFLKFEVKYCAVLVEHGGYQKAFVETGFHKTLRPAIKKWTKPYLQAFQHTVSDLREYAHHQPKGAYIIPIFDDCQEFMGQARQDYVKKNQDRKLGNMLVSNTRTYVQLQAADFLAWEYRVSVQRFIETGERRPSPVLEALESHGFGDRVWGYEMLDYLRRRVEAVNSGMDPETVELTVDCRHAGQPR